MRNYMIAASVVLASMLPAAAQELTPEEIRRTVCEPMADAVRDVAEFRDRGIPLERVRSVVANLDWDNGPRGGELYRGLFDEIAVAWYSLDTTVDRPTMLMTFTYAAELKCVERFAEMVYGPLDW